VGLRRLALLLLVAAVLAGKSPLEPAFRAVADDPLMDVRLDVNVATIDELASLPGIGPVLAAAIGKERRLKGSFGRPEDLLDVRGIGAVTLARIAPWLAIAEDGGVSESGE
jgi:competence protein ComEA